VPQRPRATGCLLLQAGIASDHVHVLVRVGAAVSLADLVQRLKGGSAYDVNRGAPPERRLCWQVGYWAESVSPADVDPLCRYLRVQRARHDDSSPLERWTLTLDDEPAFGGL
jgi:REP element-mobilizing transposase RayT